MAAGSVAIRPAVRDDLPAISALLRETWHATYDDLLGREQVAAFTSAWHGVEALGWGLGKPDHAFLVATRGERVLGTASGNWRDGAVEIIRLYVHPEAQGGGIGRLLLASISLALPPSGLRRLTVEAGNERARRFYERAGFRWTGRRASDELGDALIYEAKTEPAQAAAQTFRPARDEDAQDLFGLLSLCFAAYPGCFVDPHDDLPDLLAPGQSFAAKGGAFWVAEDERGRVCACAALDFPEPGTAEMHRLYVRPDQRRRGLARRLIAEAEALAGSRGAGRMVLWSDTRFTDAHRLYTSLGYAGGEVTRDLGDISGSVELFFEKRLSVPA